MAYVTVKCDPPKGFRVVLRCEDREVDLEPEPYANDFLAKDARDWWASRLFPQEDLDDDE